MRKLTLALLAFACLSQPAGAQQSPSFGIAGPLPSGTNALGSVLADLRVAGAAVGSGNPVPIGGTVVLGAGSASIGTIVNTAFGISGTLPAFAATPTFNLGTLNGAATAAKQPALGTAGAASADVISVQGIAGGVAQPVSLPVRAGSFLQAATATATTTASLAIGANASREMLILKNSKSSTVSIYVSASNSGSTAQAFELAPGESLTMDTKIIRGDVYVFTTSGTATFSLIQA